MSTPQILQQLGGMKSPVLPNIGQIRKLMSVVKSAQDPTALLQQMLQQNNPQLKQALDYVQQHGGNPEKAFEDLAKEKGLDPEQIKRELWG